MNEVLVTVLLFLTLFWKSPLIQLNVNAIPQLDLPLNDSLPPRDFQREKLRFQTNGHSDKALTLTEKNEQKPNENGIDANVKNFGDASNYDRDRSERFGPPYYDSDRYYYNYNNNNNLNNRYNSYDEYNRSYLNRYPDDNDDKYHADGPRGPNPYYISENERNRYGYNDYQNYYRDLDVC